MLHSAWLCAGPAKCIGSGRGRPVAAAAIFFSPLQSAVDQPLRIVPTSNDQRCRVSELRPGRIDCATASIFSAIAGLGAPRLHLAAMAADQRDASR
ncbi:MAG TPA: hypothetical protein VI279_10500 [Rhodocyclaceae bacterium]